jgi:hypothetical protein
MICPRCGRKGNGPYIKTIKGNSYLYVAHMRPKKWCYIPKHVLLSPTFFRDGRFIYTKELFQLIQQVWEAENLSNLKIKKVYVYGSHVKGTYKKNSDLDVWVVTKHGYKTPIILSATSRVVDPPRDMLRLRLCGREVEVCCSTQEPRPPFFDVFEQRMYLK